MLFVFSVLDVQLVVSSQMFVSSKHDVASGLRERGSSLTCTLLLVCPSVASNSDSQWRVRLAGHQFSRLAVLVSSLVFHVSQLQMESAIDDVIDCGPAE